MNTEHPLVSVIVPCYNQARFLHEAVKSLQAQTFSLWECIVINDGSTDATERVATVLAAADGRVRVINQANRGLSGARNRGLAEARGQFIQFLDADDALLPRKLEAQLTLLRGTAGLKLSFCDYRRGSADDIYRVPKPPAPYLPPPFGAGSLLVKLAKNWERVISIPIHCFLFDARVFTERGIRFDTTLPNHEDWDCWMQVAALPVETFECEEVLVLYRSNPASMSLDLRPMRAGFLQAIDKQRHLHRGNRELARILRAKRRETIQSYAHQLGEPRLVDCLRNRAGALARRILPAQAYRVLRGVLGTGAP